MIGTIVPRTENMVKMWRRASQDERAVLSEMHQHYEREVGRLKNTGNEPQNIAHTIHGLVDASIRHTLATHPSGRDVKCGKGCSGCCSLYVNCTHEEAVLLAGWCAANRVAIDWDKLQRQAEHDLATWSEQKASQRRCVFLGSDENCRVYEHRPVSCRKYMVFTDPKYCNTVRFPKHEVGMLAPIEGEVIASAMLGVLESGSMPRMLLQARAQANGGIGAPARRE